MPKRFCNCSTPSTTDSITPPVRSPLNHAGRVRRSGRTAARAAWPARARPWLREHRAAMVEPRAQQHAGRRCNDGFADACRRAGKPVPARGRERRNAGSRHPLRAGRATAAATRQRSPAIIAHSRRSKYMKPPVVSDDVFDRIEATAPCAAKDDFSTGVESTTTTPHVAPPSLSALRASRRPSARRIRGGGAERVDECGQSPDSRARGIARRTAARTQHGLAASVHAGRRTPAAGCQRCAVAAHRRLCRDSRHRATAHRVRQRAVSAMWLACRPRGILVASSRHAACRRARRRSGFRAQRRRSGDRARARAPAAGRRRHPAAGNGVPGMQPRLCIRMPP